MIEQLILSGLVYDEDFVRRAFPFLNEEYFTDETERVVFKLIKEFLDKYNRRPTPEALAIDLQKLTGLTQHTFDAARDLIAGLAKPNVDPTWLIERTETFCRDKAIYNALMESIQIADNASKNKGSISLGSIPELLTKALTVNFDNRLGHNWVKDAQERYQRLHRFEERVPFDIEELNRITKHGLPKKTINVLMAGVNVGKTLTMCHMAAVNLLSGLNVLYITMEMGEDEIASRIDANILDVPLGDLENLSEADYLTRVKRAEQRITGNLIIQQYPTSGASVTHFRHLLQELKLKQNFKPDIIYVDYLNICASARIKLGGSVNTYVYVKAIIEELRALAVEQDLPIVTATQVTRSGFSDSDFDMDDTSESWGVPETADFMLALISTEELEEQSRLMVKQLKNRYRDKSVMRKFLIGVDKSKMRLFGVSNSAPIDKASHDDKDVWRASSEKTKAKFEGFDMS